jgi:hypothetical protein
MVGMERTILPLIAESDFDLASRAVTLSFLVSQETLPHARLEAANQSQPAGSHVEAVQASAFGTFLRWTSWQNRSLFSASQAGLVNNLNDGLIWGLIPIFLAQHGLHLG